MPRLFIVAGPNGAGKTTYARQFLPREMNCREFVNADLIAAGLSPFAPDRAGFEAGRLMLRRLRELAAAREDLAFETTLSGRAYYPLLLEMRRSGYTIHLDFLWIPRLDITKRRIRARVRKGGHNIPEEVQERRFSLGIRNLATLYRPVLDRWRLYENSGDAPRLVAQEEHGVLSIVEIGLLAQIEHVSSVRFMPETPPRRVEEAVAFSPDSETRASMRAMRRAYATAVLENLQYGLPVVQWRRKRDAIVEVPAELLAPLARRILEVDGEELPPGEEAGLLRGVP